MVPKFSVIMEPLFETYNVMVSTASVEEMCRTTLSWLDQHCSLPALRPSKLLSLSLERLIDEQLPDTIIKKVMNSI